jgi:peptidoglycan/LPS O-acetylase OafA/YrhL
VASRLFARFSIFGYADSLAVGCLGAWLARRLDARGLGTGSLNTLVALSLGVLAAGHFVLLTDSGRMARAVVPSIQAWAAMACLWLSTDRRCILFSPLNWAPVAGLGTLSYSLYVWHLVFVGYFAGETLAAWPTHRWYAWIPCSIAVALTSYFLLERPFVALRKRLHADPKVTRP